MENISQETWQLRAVMCELLAFSLRYTEAEQAQAILSGEWKAAAEETADLLGITLPEGFGESVANGIEDEDTLHHTLRAEASRMYLPTPKMTVPPFESIWRAKDAGVQPLLYVNPHAMAVERFCKACGLDRPEGTNEPLDFIATELELMQFLACAAAGIIAEEQMPVAAAKLPGGSAEAAYDQFMTEHAVVWMPRFARAVIAETRQPFFVAAAQLLKAFIGA